MIQKSSRRWVRLHFTAAKMERKCSLICNYSVFISPSLLSFPFLSFPFHASSLLFIFTSWFLSLFSLFVYLLHLFPPLSSSPFVLSRLLDSSPCFLSLSFVLVSPLISFPLVSPRLLSFTPALDSRPCLLQTRSLSLPHLWSPIVSSLPFLLSYYLLLFTPCLLSSPCLLVSSLPYVKTAAERIRTCFQAAASSQVVQFFFSQSCFWNASISSQ